MMIKIQLVDGVPISFVVGDMEARGCANKRGNMARSVDGAVHTSKPKEAGSALGATVAYDGRRG
jgi:hypothetical protein